MKGQTKKFITSVRYVLLIIWAGITLFPIFWMVSTSLKLPNEWLVSPPVWLPSQLTLVNYQAVFAPETLPSVFRESIYGATLAALPAMRDSMIVAVAGTIGALFVGALTAYSVSRFGTGGRLMAFNILAVRMLPAIVVIIPLLIMFSSVRRLDTYEALILVNIGVTAPFVVWLMKSFFDDIPKSLEEAAIIDGTTGIRAFFSIVLPLAAGGLAVTALFVFIIIWTEFIVSLSLTFNQIVTLPVRIAKYQSATGGTLYGLQAALATVAILPPMLFGLLIQRYLVRGLTFGAIKG